MSGIEVDFLQDGGQSAASVAGKLVEFVSAAERTLEVAIYDFEAAAGASASVAQALQAAARRGVAVRVAFNLDHPRPGPPRPPKCDPRVIDGLSVPTRPITGDGALMHHKYVVRDGAEVWTGSLNWTDDAFTREENVVVRVSSAAIAGAYLANFDRLWARQKVEGSGTPDGVDEIDGVQVRAVFSPEEPSVAHLVADRLGQATKRIRVLTPVMTSGPILGTLAEFAGRHSFDLMGAYDRTQMEEVQAQWRTVHANRWKIQAWDVIASRLSGKRSTPYAQGSVHDYMHAKVVVADGEVLTGSYNSSRGGADNAENVLLLRSGALAQRFAEFADQVAARYHA